MRKLLTAVILVASAALVACGGGDDDKGGEGGTVDTGGSGGTDGTGGTGGTGGTSSDAVCGNGTIEAPETCDDKNTFDGDGCSSTCEIEGTRCDQPVSFNFLAGNPDTDNFRGIGGKLGGTESTFQASCGGDGAEIFYEYEVGANGFVDFHVEPPGATFVSVYTACGAAELACQKGGTVGMVDVTRGQKLVFAVDTSKVAQEVQYTLYIRNYALYGEGDACTPGTEDTIGSCDEGLYCATENFRSFCKGNHAPVITGATASRTGADFALSVEGADEDGNAVGAVISFYDAEGRVLPIGNIGNAAMATFQNDVSGQTTFNGQFSNNGFFATFDALDAATQMDVSVIDSGNVTSSTQRIDLTIIP